MDSALGTILTIGCICLVFYLIAKFGAWYEDKQKK